MSDGFTHFDQDGHARMVDVSAKPETARLAVAECRVAMAADTAQRIGEGGIAKGDVLGVARLAGIMAAKRTAELIPLCHPLALNSVEVDLAVEGSGVTIRATVKTSGRTGVEMEALTAASVAALTVYDMAKAVDRSMRIGDLHLAYKSGGRSGTYEAPTEGAADTEGPDGP